MFTRSFCAALLALTTTAQAAGFSFCWQGAGGYSMTGQMVVPDHLLDRNIVTEQDVTAFRIDGFHHGQHLGSWDMTQADKDTVWHLRFDPRRAEFLLGGSFPAAKSQGWNASGNVTDCGNPGFGFNSGNAAQDVCVNGSFVAESSIAPDTPLYVTPGTATGHAACRYAEFSS